MNDIAYDCQSGSYTFNATGLNFHTLSTINHSTLTGFLHTAGIDTTYTNMPVKTLSTINPVLLQVSDQSLLFTPTSQVNGTVLYPFLFDCCSEQLLILFIPIDLLQRRSFPAYLLLWFARFKSSNHYCCSNHHTIGRGYLTTA